MKFAQKWWFDEEIVKKKKFFGKEMKENNDNQLIKVKCDLMVKFCVFAFTSLFKLKMFGTTLLRA